ncbi:MAG: hypothetical protein R3F31_20605 [Verrucomicrobiales bacterium]
MIFVQHRAGPEAGEEDGLGFGVVLFDDFAFQFRQTAKEARKRPAPPKEASKGLGQQVDRPVGVDIAKHRHHTVPARHKAAAECLGGFPVQVGQAFFSSGTGQSIGMVSIQRLTELPHAEAHRLINSALMAASW